MKDPQQLLTVANSRKLRPAEINELSDHIADLERRLADSEARCNRLRVDHDATLRDDRVYVRLESAALVLTFPEQHTVRVPLSEQTQHDMAMAMHMLLRILRARPGQKNTVGTSGAPTQADLRALLAATKRQPRRVEKDKPSSLADLIDVNNLTFEATP